MGRGRPSSYDPKYCDELYEHMRAGYSLESFAGKIGVCRDTLYAWRDAHPEFSDTIKRAKEASLYWWEHQGIEGLWDDSRAFNPTVWYMNMKNRHGWRDKQPDEDGDKPKEPGSPSSPLSTDDILNLVKIVKELNGGK